AAKAAVLLASTSGHDGRTHPSDPTEDAPKQLSGHRHLGHLGTRGSVHGRRPSPQSSPAFRARWSATTARPRLATPACGGSWRGCTPAHGTGQSDGVRPESRAREPRPLHRVLPLLNPLLDRAAPVVENDQRQSGSSTLACPPSSGEKSSPSRRPPPPSYVTTV